MKIQDAILEEISSSPFRAPEIYERLLARPDLHRVRRILLLVFGHGSLYPRLRAMERKGLVERVNVVGRVAWRKSRLRDRMRGVG